METIQISRRDLLTRLFKFTQNTFQETDPLFAKYSRKEYKGRKYLGNETQYRNTDPNNSNRVVPVTSGLVAYTGQWTDREAIHLLKRTGFGFKKTHLDVLTATGTTANTAVNIVLNVSNSAPSPPINNYQPDFADENNLAYGQSWVDSFFVDNTVGNNTNTKRTESFQAWLVGTALNHDITIKEKMMHFWFHFIPTDVFVVRQSPNQYVNENSSRISFDYFKFLRNAATGNYKTLIRQMATHPAMMFYLNNQANTKTAPDENFAREIMELFTLGKGPNSLYTQDDVVAAAKVLTGWRVSGLNTATPTTAFVASRHDTTNKTFSSFFNGTIINSNGASEIDDFINMIFSKAEVVSQYICRRLYRYFVYYDIDSNIENNIIIPLAQHFVANNWSIMPVLDKLFKSQHFYDMANRGVYIKSPYDLMLGFLRTFNVNYNISDQTNHNAQYSIWLNLHYLMNNMEQGMAVIPNVSGWQAFYQNPSFHEYWINSNSIQKRYAYIAYVFYGIDVNKNGFTTKIKADNIAFVKQFTNDVIENPVDLINQCIRYLLPIDLSVVQKDAIKVQTLLSGQASNANYYWTDAWNDYANNPNNASFKQIVSSRLDNLFLTLIQLAEFQLM